VSDVKKSTVPSDTFVQSFRHSAPYIHAHRGRTFIILFSGETAASNDFAGLIHDIALLHSLGIHLVLVHGARPQIEQRLHESHLKNKYAQDLRITDDKALAGVKQTVGSARVEIEALLSMGLPNTPMAGAHIRVSSGNFVTARPLGVRDGVDFCHTGEVRRIDGTAIRQALDDGQIVLLSPLGYSPTGEIFNLRAEDVATHAATELRADKLILLLDEAGLKDSRRRPIRHLTLAEAERTLAARRALPAAMQHHLASAIEAARHGVRRVHLVSMDSEGALLRELFTRDGIGTLITAETYEGLRRATIEDAGGILELIQPLEMEGILVRRSRELLEMEISHFSVIERDGMVIACAAMYPFPTEGYGEIACLAVHPDYRSHGRGEALLQSLEDQARHTGIKTLFVLTTRTAHWFRERGFQPAQVSELPVKRRQLYNYQRNSKIFTKGLD
jgi:amino-acid N-acetyltransferase